MFILTLHKNSLRRAAALVVCMGCLAGTVAGVSHLATRSVPAAANVAVTVSGTQDISAYFSDHGVEVDPSTAAVDSVKIPKRWDDSFLAFNTVVAQSGLSLEGYKGKTVEKWTLLSPGLSGGEEKVYAVMLVYKEQAVGAYLLAQPSGEVSPLAAPTGAWDSWDLSAEAAETGMQWPTE